MMIIDPYRFAEPLILDIYSGANAAYSVRKLRTAYAGSCMRVRRSSDNSEQDIGFVSNLLDTASLLSFVGANNGFVVTWYDQSGNGYNATNATAAEQPQIVSAGTLITVSSQPALSCYSKNLFASTMVNASPQSTFSALINELLGNDAAFVLPFGTIDQNDFFSVAQDSSASSASQNVGAPSHFVNNIAIGNTRNDIWDAIVTGNKQLYNCIGGGNGVTGRYLQYNVPGFSGNYKVFEVIIYNSDKSADRTNINNNIKTYFNIY